MTHSLFQFWLRAFAAPHRGHHRISRVGIAVLALLSAGMPVRGFAAANAIEYQVKAGFLFNFAKFVEWPAASQSAHSDLRLGIIAPDEIYELMGQALDGKMVGERPIRVERITAADVEKGAALPQIIFIHQDIQRLHQDLGFNPSQLFALAEKQSVLIVGESAGFATSGGIIGFVQRGENLRFQVNLAKAQRAGLKLSARLSGLAEIVTSSQ